MKTLFNYPRTEEEVDAYQKKFDEFMHDVIENMSMYDDNLKLKL